MKTNIFQMGYILWLSILYVTYFTGNIIFQLIILQKGYNVKNNDFVKCKLDIMYVSQQ